MTIFDLIKSPPEGKQGYIDLADELPEASDDSFLRKASDYGKTILKGTIEGVSRLGRMLGPLETPGKEESQLFEEQTQRLEELIPGKEGFAQKSIRRGLQQAPSMLAFPGS